MPRSWAGVSRGWLATSAAMGRQQPAPRSGTLDRVVTCPEHRAPGGLLGHDPDRIELVPDHGGRGSRSARSR